MSRGLNPNTERLINLLSKEPLGLNVQLAARIAHTLHQEGVRAPASFENGHQQPDLINRAENWHGLMPHRDYTLPPHHMITKRKAENRLQRRKEKEARDG